MEWKEVESHPKLSKLEEKVRKFWEKEKIFERSVEGRPVDKSFTFYDGPPFATGLPHYGHIMQGYMKDSIPRYWTMKGYKVERRFGWDCHGLPIENIVEKELELKTKKDVEELGVAEFCERCESKVLTYAEDWKEYVKKSGRWVDMENAYRTMDLNYMESVWWVFKQVYDKGHMYKGRKSVWVCPRCATPLSQIEVNDQSVYQDTEDPSIIVKFKLAEKENEFLLAWTTTPWTIPANVLLGVDPAETYAKAKLSKAEEAEEEPGKYFYFAKKRQEDMEEMLKTKFSVVGEFKGKEIVGTKYEPVFPDMKTEEGKVHEVVEAEFVTMDEGTGIVHMAPAYGEDDFELGKKLGAGFVQHLSIDGYFSEPEGIKGMHIWNKKSKEKLIEMMQEKNALLFEGTYKHSYPHCWRCDTKLFNYGMDAWFVNTTDMKDQLYNSLEDTYWIPEYAKTGRLGDWMKNLRDWCISRNRYWGTPLPVWECDKCENREVLGSVEELEKKSGEKVSDLHRNHVDQLSWGCDKCKEGTMKRTEEVLDCWFESGAMPYALPHYPFENKVWFEENFPADFVGEAIEQSTKWFFTLLVLGTALFSKAPYKNVVNTGIILAEDGNKMSKSKKNYPDPLKMFDNYGSDAMRLFIFNSPVMRGEFMRFSEQGIKETTRNLLMLYWNTYKFFVTYAKLHNWKPDPKKLEDQQPIEKKLEKMLLEKPKANTLDQWIVARTADLVRDVNAALEKYDLWEAVKPLQPFVWDLSTWYVRRNRNRFAEGDEKAFETLHFVLHQFTLVAAPLMPFTTEAVWQGLVKPWSKDADSVHLAMMPTLDENYLKQSKSLTEAWNDVKKQVKLTRDFVSLGHRLRDQNKFKVRQPLSRALVFHPEFKKDKDLEHALKEELNVQELLYGLDEPKDGKWVETKEGNDLAVSLDLKLTPELEAEGLKRELVRMVNAQRKKTGKKLGEKAEVTITLDADTAKKAGPLLPDVENKTNSKVTVENE